MKKYLFRNYFLFSKTFADNKPKVIFPASAVPFLMSSALSSAPMRFFCFASLFSLSCCRSILPYYIFLWYSFTVKVYGKNIRDCLILAAKFRWFYPDGKKTWYNWLSLKAFEKFGSAPLNKTIVLNPSWLLMLDIILE